MSNLDKKIRPRVVLFEPRIPQNTGNIARTCAAYNLRLELIKPLGFSLEDKYLKRAGLDYWKYLDIVIHEQFTDFLKYKGSSRILGLSKLADKSINNFEFKINDILMFGREDNGIPNGIKNNCDQMLSISMPGGSLNNKGYGVRSLNLSVACGIVIYKACEQLDIL